MDKTINYYHVDIGDRTGIIKSHNGFTVKTLNVLAENDEYMVVDDRRFTTIAKKKHSFETSLDDESISLYAMDKVWGNRVSYHLYTFKNVRASTVRNHIEKAIREKFGFFLSGIDLSCITEEAAKQVAPTKGEEAK